jgi:cell division protein FtsW (lipid II flippase)
LTTRAARLDRPVSEPWVFVLLVLALMALGIVMVYSAGQGVPASADNYYFTRHLMFVPAALGALTLGVWFPSQRLKSPRVALVIMGLAALLLVLVLVPGIGEDHSFYASIVGTSPLVQRVPEYRRRICLQQDNRLAGRVHHQPPGL